MDDANRATSEARPVHLQVIRKDAENVLEQLARGGHRILVLDPAAALKLVSVAEAALDVVEEYTPTREAANSIYRLWIVLKEVERD